MKNKYFIFFSIILIFSCSNNEDTLIENRLSIEDEFPQTWTLVQLNTGLSGIILNGDEISYRETLTLNNDATFLRTIIEENRTLNAQGSFSISTTDNGNQLLLVHNDASELINNCSNSKEELLTILDATQLEGGALPCDGPGLLYERLE